MKDILKKTIIALWGSRKDKRTLTANKNAIFSLFFKMANIIANLMLVPLLIDVLDNHGYGLWLTIFSVVRWVGFFDLGLGNGLRNKFAEAKAKGDFQLAKEYISTSYITLLAFLSMIWILFLLFYKKIDWCYVFNVKDFELGELSKVVFVVFSFYLIQFLVNLIVFILRGDQKNAFSDAILPVSTILSFLITWIYREQLHNDLYSVVLILSITPAATYFCLSIFYFSTIYRRISPSFSSAKLIHVNVLFSLGLRYFVIQICGMIIFSTSNIIIAHFCSLTDVAIYNTAYKLFQVPFMIYGIFINPLWSAVTDAYYHADFDWLKSNLKRMINLNIFFAIISLLLFFVSDYIFEIWLNGMLFVPKELSIMLTVSFVLSLIFNPYSLYLNGMGKLKISSYVVLAKTVLFFPVTIFFTQLMGPVGTLIGIVVINSISYFIEPFQVRKVLTRKAQGIWNS